MKIEFFKYYLEYCNRNKIKPSWEHLKKFQKLTKDVYVPYERG